jgi:hypothetical protein
VTAISATDVWAVGFYDDGTTFRTLAEHWNGSVWSVVATPNAGADENVLESVSGAASGDVWAVGYRQDSPETPRQALALHWTGSAWSVVSTPATSGDSYLYSVRARTPTDVWAVGSFSVPWFQTLTEHWNGSTWTVVNSPNQGNGNNVLYAAVVLSSTSAVAVGNWINGNQTATLSQYWNGSSWAVVPSPSPAGYVNFLVGADASAPNDVWAVGWGLDSPFGTSRNLAEHWNGHAWKVVPTPNVGTEGNALAMVARIPGTTGFWAVGNFARGGANHTLVEFRC